MVLVRDVFQIEPQQMREAKTIVLEMRALEQHLGHPPMRVLTDLTGEYYTLVLESGFPSLGEFERALAKEFADPEWQKQYSRFRPMIRSGRREIFQVVE